MHLPKVALNLAVAVAVTFSIPAMAQAEGLRLIGSKKNRGAMLASQMALLDGRHVQPLQHAEALLAQARHQQQCGGQ